MLAATITVPSTGLTRRPARVRRAQSAGPGSSLNCWPARAVLASEASEPASGAPLREASAQRRQGGYDPAWRSVTTPAVRRGVAILRFPGWRLRGRDVIPGRELGQERLHGSSFGRGLRQCLPHRIHPGPAVFPIPSTTAESNCRGWITAVINASASTPAVSRAAGGNQGVGTGQFPAQGTERGFIHIPGFRLTESRKRCGRGTVWRIPPILL